MDDDWGDPQPIKMVVLPTKDGDVQGFQSYLYVYKRVTTMDPYQPMDPYRVRTGPALAGVGSVSEKFPKLSSLSAKSAIQKWDFATQKYGGFSWIVQWI